MDEGRLSSPATRGDLVTAPFKPRAPWWGGDLQTIANYLRSRVQLDAYAQERLILPLADGTGDRLAATLSRPAAGAKPLPLAVLLHGLGGDENSYYMRRTAAHLLALGYPVLRLNLRGAGLSRPLCRLQYHGGRSGDLAMALAALPPARAAQGFVAVGFSLGGNMLLKFLGEQESSSPVRAGVSVSAPIDLELTSRQMLRWRNRLYQAYLLRDMRVEAVAPMSEVTDAERRAVRNVRSIWEFDELFSAPRNGYASAVDFYARNSAQNFLDRIGVPTLVIHAFDDPWVPSEPYRAFDWQGNPHLVPALVRHGGHIGFHGSHSRTPWHDAQIAQFFAAALSRT